MSEWYICDDQGLDGPYSLNELMTMLREGELGATEEVQQGRDGTPVAARDVPELRSAASTAPRRKRAAQRSNQSSGTTWIIILAVFAGVACLGCLILLPALLLPAVQQVREAARRSQSQDHLHNIVQAMHNYESTHRVLPPGGIFADDGTEHHGWATFLLPYVEQAPLYDSIDVEHTRWRDSGVEVFFRTQVPAYLNQSASESMTADGFAAANYSANRHVFHENSGTRFADILDGTSNTQFVGEIGADYPAWGSCHNFRDLARGLGKTGAQFGSPMLPGCQIGMGDGKISALSATIDTSVLQALATHDGGESVQVP